MKATAKVVWLAVALLVLTTPVAVLAQTSNSALVQGTVFDPSQAVVPGATVEIRDATTNVVFTQTTNPAGLYVFSKVPHGNFKLTVTAQGFRTAVIPTIDIDVAKSYTININLEIGAMAETVEVTAGTGIELQTTDATVGTVYGGEGMLRLPTGNRSVAPLLLLQPLVVPTRGGLGSDYGGQVSGARSDQSTFLLDGGDATNNTEGSGGYNTGFAGDILPTIPVPSESIEEFRVSTSNPNATFGRSQGGQISMITKRGTNDLHGSVYWYHQNDNLDATRWDFNCCGIAKPEKKDNRYGFSVGGPVWKDRTWLYGHFEGRRFPRSADITRLVPTATLADGILRFRDGPGNVISYNLNPANGALAATCGAAGNLPCDPRGIGISPVIASLFALYPAGNAAPTSGADGRNTDVFRGAADNSLSEEFVVARWDQKITDKWNFFASYRYSSTRQPGIQQVDITGGNVRPTRSMPLQPRYIVGGFTGQITPNLTSDTRISWLRHWWQWATTAPFPQVAGTAAGLDVATESIRGFLSEPINFDTQNARSRVWNGKDTYVGQDFTWIRGRHTWQFGGTFRNQNIFHSRTDKVTGGLTTGPLFYITDAFAGGHNIGSAQRPPACATSASTNCLRSGDISRWDAMYSTVLGLMDKVAQIGARDGDFNALPLGSPFSADVTIRAYEFFAQDIWRITPSFTLTLGMAWQLQKPPVEAVGKQVLQVYADTLMPVYLDEYFQRRAEAASQGLFHNPDLAYIPINFSAQQKYVANIDWNNFGPRVAASWNPSFENWFFGNRKTVIRGGYSLTYTRMNGVGLVMTPLLGVGLGSQVVCLGPNSAGVCTGSGTTPVNAFRVGPDGNGAGLLAQLNHTSVPIPFIPPTPISDRSNTIDPGFQLGKAHSLDLTWQRELPSDLLLEVGYVGRWGRNLSHNRDLGGIPFFWVDPVSGQTLAEAFDALAEQVRTGAAITDQPFFENMMGDYATLLNLAVPSPGYTSNTDALEGEFSGDISDGFMGFTMFEHDIECQGEINANPLADCPVFSNVQLELNNITSDGSLSNYHAAFVSLRKRMSQGFTFDVNYTFSKSLDQFGLNQENTSYSYLSVFNQDFDYAPSIWDRRHVLNATGFWELPFGRGRRWSTGNWFDKVIGGWHLAGIFTANSGIPLCFFAGQEFGSPTGGGCMLPTGSFSTGGNQVHDLGGGDLNLFADPSTLFNSFRRPQVTLDGRGATPYFRGLPRWMFDLSLGKTTAISERVAVHFTFDFLNVFNRVEFEDPSTSVFSEGAFGVLSGQFGNPRTIQFGLRVEF